MHDKFDGISHPPKLMQDMMRKAMPVDTAALKDRIKMTEMQKQRYANDTGPGASMMRKVVDDRLAAKQDTLAAARKKKGG